MGCISIFIFVALIIGSVGLILDGQYFSGVVSILAFVGIFAAIKANKNKSLRQAEERTKKMDELLKHIESEGLPSVATSLILSPREKCHYQGPCTRLITTRRVTRYEGGSRGVSVRVAKGLTVRGGSSRGVPIREDVVDRFSGEIAITNKRIAFLGAKGFEFTFGQITALDYYADAIAFQVKDKRYVISSPEIDYIQIIVDEVMECYKLHRA